LKTSGAGLSVPRREARTWFSSSRVSSKTPAGNPKIQHPHRAKAGDDLRDVVNQKLFPYLHAFKQKATRSNTSEYEIGEIFGEIKDKISSGYNLIDQIGLSADTRP
jgi:hypothetical protein